ncbi:MAG: DUF1549 and DUF1553 domain-containing protein [Planctomycetota bacterium]|nr:DUF1549 and DUF1553 domain-containing protein [Planctomycetota bacterium]
MVALIVGGLYSSPVCGDESPQKADVAVYGITPEPQHYQHWAFVPPARPSVPSTPASQSSNPIDRFIAAALAERGLAINQPADPSTWLRRVTIDLTGLPPSAEEIAAFAADHDPDARARVVDRLLADPGYGVRWGRRWLDVARFAETNGYERDGPKSNAWRYRDWVIDSLNRDKPYDRFVIEQMSGDELPDRSAETLIATTFLRLGTWDDEPADPVVDRYEQLDDIVGTVSTAFLGLTLRCARCHNHKFEPLSQIDYASFLSVFDPMKRPQEGRSDLDVAVGTDRELAEHKGAVARQEAAVQAVRQQLSLVTSQVRDRYFLGGPKRLSPAAFEAHRLPPDQRNPEQKSLVEKTNADLLADLADSSTPDERRQQMQFESALRALADAAPAPLPRAYIWQEPAGPPALTQVFRRGNPATPAGVVDPGIPKVLSRTAQPVSFTGSDKTTAGNPGGGSAVTTSPHANTSQRRTALARWMTDRGNPLVARVIVNRLWQGHFGEGLVSSENDFGVMGSPPSHPELLDWLANSLMDNGWSLKSIHRLIVLSETYAQSSEWNEAGSKVDVDNRLLWRFPYRRLEAEVVRDTVLVASGRLNHAMGGPGVFPKIHQAVLEGQSRPGDGWGKPDAVSASRRSAYVYVKRSLLVPELELLDFADTTSSCEQRVVSTIPTQALTLLNGEFFNEQARSMADRVRRESPAGDTRATSQAAAWVTHGYRLAVGRLPTPEELSESVDFLNRQRRRLEQETAGKVTGDELEQRALATWCLVLFNLNEFAYVD